MVTPLVETSVAWERVMSMRTENTQAFQSSSTNFLAQYPWHPANSL